MQLELAIAKPIKDVFINTVTIRLKTGQVIILDRNKTVYGNYSDSPGYIRKLMNAGKATSYIVFRELYEWNGERELHLPPPKEFEGAVLTHIEYEEDDWIPEDYSIEIAEAQMYSDDTGEIKIKVNLEPENYQKRIRMYLLDDDRDDYEAYFTNRIENNTPILARYEFDTMKEFMETWKKISDDPITMWYWVYDGENIVCSGAIDPNDEEIFTEYFEMEG